SLTTGGIDERKAAFESRMRNEVKDIVDSVVGPGRARVQIAAEFDFKRVTQTTDKYDPDSRVVRSSQTREEEDTSGNRTRVGGAVSVSNELPGSGAAANEQTGNSGNHARKTEEVVNYEISRTSKTEIIEPGRLKRVSAAVLVDGIYTRNAQGAT